MSRSDTQPTRVISNRTSVRQRMAEIWRFRELLVGLVRKELKVKYKNSILGFVWSMLNPALYLVVFYVVFQIVLKNGIPGFAIFLLSGLLELVLLAWFWMTPIVYPYRHVADRLGTKAILYRLTPITPIVLTFQRAIYNRLEPPGLNGGKVNIPPVDKGPMWYLAQLAVVGVCSAVLFAFALRVFGRLEGNFAEEL